MIVKGVIFEDFVNYKKPCMTIEFPKCSFKCDHECGMEVCQNSALPTYPNIEVDIDKLVKRYVHNPITHAVVMQGLEPFDSWNELYQFIDILRHKYKNNDDIVIYTGYKENEITEYTTVLSSDFDNIIIKFGRFIPNSNSIFDDILGVTLASDNQYAMKIS